MFLNPLDTGVCSTNYWLLLKCVFMYIWLYSIIYIDLNIFIYTHVHTTIHIYIHLYIYINTYIYIYMIIYIHKYTHIYIYIYSYTIYIYICIHLQYIYVYVCVFIFTCIHAYICSTCIIYIIYIIYCWPFDLRISHCHVGWHRPRSAAEAKWKLCERRMRTSSTARNNSQVRPPNGEKKHPWNMVIQLDSTKKNGDSYGI
jgi:hypothetical protein